MNEAERDEPIPPDEELYRGIEAAWVSPDGRLLPDAIDKRGSSCVRQKYGKPAEAKNVERGRTGVAVTTGARLPSLQSYNGVEYECFVVHEPHEGIAHAEIRVRRVVDRESRDNRFPGSSDAREKLKTVIARSFGILESPVAKPPEETPSG